MEMCYISVGSNIGDKLLNCNKGIDAIEQNTPSVIIARSRFYRTEPVDFTDQSWFINGVVKIETSLEPIALFHALKAIEKEAGTTEKIVRFGPRVLDLDILLYGNQVINMPELIIPHPRMDKRRFVLQPLCDIDAGMEHPVLKKEMAQLLMAITDPGQKVMALYQ
ncbi:MAG: 2-amino-4-hydroxy-6-hydroxymethyldihydropteridine diphosphokinase [Proteobacteria bacterium]|nr:2-amino-4-hydroxy-6-hydroxymethyldihydropteridine diphosphokinase [Pseudomonadota bacterium]